MRLLFVTSGLSRGGAELFLTRLLPGLVARGHACAVASLQTGSALSAELIAAGIPVAGGARFLREARRFRPDVVQGWMYRGNLAALLTSSLAPGRSPVVWSVRQGLNDLPETPRLTKWLIGANARFSRRPYAIVYNAESARRQHEAHGFAGTGARVIPNGIDVSAAPRSAGRTALRAALGISNDAFVVAMPARFHPVKNHRGFAQAAGIFARGHPEARFILAGSGIDANNASLVAWLRHESIRDRVLLLGERPDVANVIGASDVVTLASHGEAFPNALLEAMALGVPCVATNVGDISDIIGDTGYVVPAGDPAALAAGWQRMASLDDPTHQALGAQARERVARLYGLDRAVVAFESLYLEAVAARAGASASDR